jgi:heme-degrading monooxygenase HmoA
MNGKVITRVWHGRTLATDADRYFEFLVQTAVPDYSNTPGNISVELWRRIEDDVCHFWTITKWDDYDSIRNFAGEEIAMAKYYPEDTKYLLEFEDNVIHCETYTF